LAVSRRQLATTLVVLEVISIAGAVVAWANDASLVVIVGLVLSPLATVFTWVAATRILARITPPDR
jgi:hypothetical protein